MGVRAIVVTAILALPLVLFVPDSFAGMHGGSKGGEHSGMMEGSSEKGHMMDKGHGGGMEKHGSMGTQVFSGEAFGTSITGSMVDITAKMAKMGKGMAAPSGITHHFMLTPEKSLGEGAVAKVTITSPGGEKKEIELAPMGNHIGSDLNLSEKGQYAFTCTVNSGSESKSFEFAYEVK